MNIGLKDKVAVITGGTMGIGEETALLFCEEQARVAVCGRNQERVNELIKRGKVLGYDIYGESVDVSEQEQVNRFLENVADYYGGIDILVNNAGVAARNSLLKQNREDWDYITNINLASVWYAIQAVVPYMEKRGGGAIVSTSSVTSHCPTTSSGAYGVTKAGVNCMTQAFASELASRHIRVNAVSPGVVRTRIIENLVKSRGEDTLAKMTVMQRLGNPREIAYCIVFLASDAASYVTGQILEASGGKCIVQDPEASWK